MSTWRFVIYPLASVLAATSGAAAQPMPPPADPWSHPAPAPDPAPAPAPAPDPAPAPAPAPDPAPGSATAPDPGSATVPARPRAPRRRTRAHGAAPSAPRPAAPPTYRPTDASIGIGFGYQLPTSLQTPNVTSLRIRRTSGFTLEPQLVIAVGSRELPAGPFTQKSMLESSEVKLGMLLRIPLGQHGRADLEMLTGVSFDRITETRSGSEPSDPDSTFDLTYGFAMGMWLSPHWQVSLAGLSPLVRSTHRSSSTDSNFSTSTRLVGLIFEPRVTVMVHAYY